MRKHSWSVASKCKNSAAGKRGTVAFGLGLGLGLGFTGRAADTLVYWPLHR